MILPLLALVTAGKQFPCKVVSVHDGDGPIHCASGASVRLAGIQAPDFADAEPCRKGRAEFVCSDRAATEARDRMRKLIQGRTLDCTAAGRSYRRIVATCRLGAADLSCLAIQRGIATRWQKYDRQRVLVRCEPKRLLHLNAG
ncbi:thermonuclease family protein [Sphingomonas crusticola]|uniref:thermonuclease family protein n=1 Tax=Sphingomonas crusticola TaxID=1697973 RepID=UPI000E282E6C|nr:thermonuclease family protein [Sphingomonas crusticola]